MPSTPGAPSFTEIGLAASQGAGSLPESPLPLWLPIRVFVWCPNYFRENWGTELVKFYGSVLRETSSASLL